MEYDDSSPIPIEGAFYATASYQKPTLNYFREEQVFDLNALLSVVDDDEETAVLKDNNLLSIKQSPEFAKNKRPDTPTNRICTSLFQRERIAFLLEFGVAYVKERSGIQKHIMRYPQIFATKAIEQKLLEGVKKGIIWHTQGSGKTALAYYNVKYLSNYFQNKNIIAKFYFIVDRLDLLIQASREFKARGLIVHNIDSKEAFARDIKQTVAIHNDSGKAEITVVNIHKFKDDPDVIKNVDYNLNIQRVFFLDEVHRSYNPKGSFLANLEQADRDAIKLGLTGTPLLGEEYNSKLLFGGYMHKYYYNASIKDGYTLRLIREDIETSYKINLQNTLAAIYEETEILKGSGNKKLVYAHKKFVEPMLDYIIKDFEQARISMNDNTIGGMVVCDSSEQAKMMYDIFQAQYAKPEGLGEQEQTTPYSTKHKLNSQVNSAAVILHDIGTKDERKQLVEDFKEGKIDFLFVFNMLLTGFDAPRLKKLFIGRVIKAHNLLQALTRVNRPYQNFNYGYVVDFADIESEFEKTNRDYFKELQSELGDEIEHYTNLFKSQEEILKEIQEIKEVLFHFDTTNAEMFSSQISQINSRYEMLKITHALNNAKSLYNLIRLSGDFEMLERLDFKILNILSREADRRLALINTKEALENNVDASNLLNVALEDVIFSFTKVNEAEMVLADELKDVLQRTREGLGDNFDQQDLEFISLKEELERLFKKKNLSEISKEQMESNIKALNDIYNRAKELERKNQLLRAKYDNDEKYARLHKRLMEKDPLTDSESKLFDALKGLKTEVDNQIQQNAKMLENESFVEKMVTRIVIDQFKNKHHIPLTAVATKRINGLVVKEYMNEYYGRAATARL
ncbi:DEAD/DEAH box helicase family protein [Candidatus Berkiella cookevillensis]|uniref:DEAD/DEAH box helicase family protein n=1 Tax=Candidatus Berkiella cookevillensis TaxID=437022 RepID=A0A0Q9Y8Z5_9GAMM|nr:DEAD/DEAH box helicase family protein [Candidatus Berkiella cookevillensis]MCS5707784.1 DEAD/DEAH box helicase family protein [Candidatus Berkiella cookevillensis]